MSDDNQDKPEQQAVAKPASSFHKAKKRRFFKDTANTSFKHLALKYNNTRLAQTIDSLQLYKKVYYLMMENELPIFKSGERQKKARRAERTKQGILVSFALFFFLYSKIGFFNRLMFCLVSTQSLVFLTKCYFYKQCIDELNFEMTLTG